MGILFGLAAAFSWGIGDFFVARATRRIGSLRTLLITQIVGFSIVGLIILSQSKIPQTSGATWCLAFFLGALNLIAVQLIYRAFQIGKLSLVSPLASSYTIITALLAFASGERPTTQAIWGASLLMIGVLLATQNKRHSAATSKASPNAGLFEAASAAMCFGIVFWGLNQVVPGLGLYWPIFLLRVVTLIGASILWFAWVKPRQPATSLAAENEVATQRIPVWWIASLAACCETAAWLSFNAGTQTEFTAVVTALSSLFSVFAIIFGRIFFKEELTRMQWAGVAIILSGILLVSIKP